MNCLLCARRQHTAIFDVDDVSSSHLSKRRLFDEIIHSTEIGLILRGKEIGHTFSGTRPPGGSTSSAQQATPVLQETQKRRRLYATDTRQKTINQHMDGIAVRE